jgi:NAD(P)-dependent dehydrogenase (short-subunit alcohol dehydrogenase family)
MTSDTKPTPTWRISLEGKLVLVTGASRGIGEAIACAAAEAGARLLLVARKLPDLDRVAARIRAGGGQAVAVACHTGKPDEIAKLFARAAELGDVDGLVNNAATNPFFGPLLDIPEAAFDKTFEVNLKGYLNLIRAFVSTRRQRGMSGGSIVNIASIAALRASPMQGAYAMTKAAVISMTQTLAVELGSSGIRVNAIAPGLVETRFASAIVENPAIRNLLVERTPLRRHAQPEEIAAAAVYLLSPASSFATGSVVAVDGGYLAQ